MAQRKGLVWSRGGSPGDLAAQVSARRDELSGQVEGAMQALLNQAVDHMEQIAYTGGVKNHVSTGGPRARPDSFAMIRSIDSKLDYAKGSGRVRGQFGYLDGAPDYTIYQEEGTVNQDLSERIKPLLAFAEAYQTFKDNAEQVFGELNEGF